MLGIGINVNIGYNQFPSDLRNIATSLAIETGRECSRLELTIRLYENLAKWYKQLLQNGFHTIKEKWLNLAPMMGANVQVLFREQLQAGRLLTLMTTARSFFLQPKIRKLKSRQEMQQ